jgi:hypothetical protein
MSTERTMPEATIALVGAGGKMGTRITGNLMRGGCTLLLCETAPEGVRRLADRGLAVSAAEAAVPRSEVVVLAVPDRLVGSISAHLVPLMKPGATLIILDPAAAYVGELALRPDCSFVATHPCHPALFGEQDSPEARADLFGGIAATQDIVIALVQGSEDALELAEGVCRCMFAPVAECHRITVEQMALLEPAAAEVVVAAAAVLMRQALEEAVRQGVPESAARAFLLGHTQIPLAIAFGKVSSPFSDAAKIAIEVGFERVIRPDWRKVFDRDVLRETVRRMLHPN